MPTVTTDSQTISIQAPLADLMESAATAVLETMFMTGVENSTEWTEVAAPYADAASLAILLRFEGALAGEFRLCLEESTARSLASTLLCLDANELPYQQTVQLAGELTNMLCGSLLSHLAPKATLTLGSPALVECMAPLPGGTNRLFDLPEGQLAVTFRLDGTK